MFEVYENDEAAQKNTPKDYFYPMLETYISDLNKICTMMADGPLYEFLICSFYVYIYIYIFDSSLMIRATYVVSENRFASDGYVICLRSISYTCY